MNSRESRGRRAAVPCRRPRPARAGPPCTDPGNRSGVNPHATRSTHSEDAHTVAAAVEAVGGIIQIADPDDLTRLSAPYWTVAVEPLAPKKGAPN
ncbi:MAG TPA: hypothetical protein VF070_07900 [Streptosporangiaceae bacterium]